jgi:excinuclease ABC subunit C
MGIDFEITTEHLDLGGVRAGTAEEYAERFDISRVSTGPGCYVMKDPKGKPIYVGKAKNLRARLRSYIHETDSRYSVKFLMRRVAGIDLLVTANEKEALLLENSLIKQYKPRYNVRLRDDKTFLSLRIDPKQVFPRITTVRRYKRDGARYFGPYSDSGAMRQTLREMQRLFPLRTCSDHVLHNRKRPCLYYQMKRCAAPCVGHISKEDYSDLVEQAALALEGRSDELDRRIKEKIQRHAEALEFEEAAQLRDRLFALQRTFERQRTVAVAGAEDRDVFGLYTEGRYTEIQVLFYRKGRLIGGRSFSFERTEMPLEEILGSFLLQYYGEAPAIPQEVLIPLDLEEAGALSELLSEQRGTHVTVHWPQRGDKLAMLDMARRNAKRSFDEKRLREKAQADVVQETQKALGLTRPPERIECFDISTIQGTKTVGSMVVFEGGEANKQRYRRYAVRGVEGQDDFASMREVLMRRYTRAIEENDLPSLVLIDGGKGQLGVAATVLKDLGIEDIPLASIAKSRAEEGGRSPERFFVPGRMNPILLPQSGAVVHFLARIRDEAHRFAITYHRQRRKKSTFSTTLTGIPGVGPAKARALLHALGSVAKIREARIEDIVAVPGFNEKLAHAVLHHIQSGDNANKGGKSA